MFHLGIENHGTEAVKLKKGSLIGEVVPVEEFPFNIPANIPEAAVCSLDLTEVLMTGKND